MSSKGSCLILLPNVLSDQEEDTFAYLTKRVEEKVLSLDGLIAESEKGARRYLKRFTFPEGKSFREVPLALLNEHTNEKELQDLLKPIIEGQTWGLVSDAGLPCIADPGASLVSLARKKGVIIEALPGPSSLFLALMLSGLPAQRFSFHGYLEKDPARLRQEIKLLEKESKQKKITQLCIEAPYRSENLYEIFLETLEEETELCIASDLSTQEERVNTYRIREWKKKPQPDLHKRPTVFLFLSKNKIN